MDEVSGALANLSMLVTGGGSGIGRAVVDAYVAAGGRVVVLERSPERASEVRRDHGGAVSVVVGDATDGRAIADAVGRAVGEHGWLDQLTCCVGVFDYYASLRAIDPERIQAAAEEIWRANVLSVLLAAAHGYPYLRKRGGSMTLTISGAAFHAEGGGVLYGSSK
ncbi:MAG: SDR family NAD(P)-dependent oxidoreductase, partial [Sciscionella sp.]